MPRRRMGSGCIDLCILEWSASRHSWFFPRERDSGTRLIGCYVDPIAGLDDLERRTVLPPQELELQTFGCPVCSQSLYRPHYRGSSSGMMVETKNQTVLAKSVLSSRIKLKSLPTFTNQN
jgi:hypothetical protein